MEKVTINKIERLKTADSKGLTSRDIKRKFGKSNYNFLKFKKPLPLIIINLLIMCFLFPLGIIAISDFVIVPFDKFQILLFSEWLVEPRWANL